MILRQALFSITVTAILITGCSYTPQSRQQASGSDVGGTGKISYTHEDLGNTKHLLTVTAAPGLMETEGSIKQRIHVFANKFAATTCPSKFEFVHDPNFNQDIAAGFMKRTISYVFICSS